MATKNPNADAEDLLGGPADDLLGGSEPAPAAKKAKSKSKPAAKAEAAPAKKAKPKAAAKAEAAPAKKAKPKAAKAASGARGVRGQGKFYFDPDARASLVKSIRTHKKPVTTKEAAEKYGVETWQARLAMNDLVKEERGSFEKLGSVLVYNPA